MTDETEQNAINYVSGTDSQQSNPQVPPDSELFAGRVYEKLSAQQVFVGDENFYRSLMTPDRPAATQSKPKPPLLKLPNLPPKRFSNIKRILITGIILIAAALLYRLVKSQPQYTPSVAALPPKPVVPQTKPAQPQPVDTTQNIVSPEETVAAPPKTVVSLQKDDVQTQIIEPAPLQIQPLSLNFAQNLYLNEKYEQAFSLYEKLHQSLSKKPKENLMKDFLLLQMALCRTKTAQYKQANRLLRTVSNSPSPAVRVLANYHRCLLEIRRKQYLNAQTKAYRTIALIDAVEFDPDWALALKQDCWFLAAEAITRKVLELSNADKDIPEKLWTGLIAVDNPFVRINETQLRTLLNSGLKQLNETVLKPQIQLLDQKSQPAAYAVTCQNAPIEEVLARFTAAAGLELHWNLDPNDIGIRKQAVSIYLPNATTQQIATVTAGCAGLFGRLHKKDTLNVHNPAKYSRISKHLSLLEDEAVSLWQKFLFSYHDDPRIPNAHFALALLQIQKEQPAEAAAEYKLIANRFSNSSLAPLALLNSSRLKADMQNYPGSREDLMQLVEQYADTEIAENAYLSLADITANAGLKTEAVRLYSKVYHLSLSADSQTAAAFGAANCSYEIKDYQSAVKWSTRHITLTKEEKPGELYSAYSLLGKAKLAMGDYEVASKAFQRALAGGPKKLSKEEYIETISALVKAYIKQKHFSQALNLLENIPPVALSQDESIEISLLKGRVLRKIGLIEKAIALLDEKAEYISDYQLKTRITLELADCYIENGNLNFACDRLTNFFIIAEPGPLTQQAVLKLADVCLKLDRYPQAASVCLQLLDMQPPEKTKQKALELLAKAYDKQKYYNKATLALLGQWK